VNVASEYAARIPHLFVDLTEHDHISDLCLIDLPEPDHTTPTVNMVNIRQIGQDSLSTISEEGNGSIDLHRVDHTRTLIDSYGQEFSAFPPGFGGAVFIISNDEPPCNGRPIKRGLLRKKETPIVGLGESTWKT
jgi:hypothetical protein